MQPLKNEAEASCLPSCGLLQSNPPPLLCSIILNSTGAKMKTKASVIDSESLLAIGRDAIGTWKRIP